MGAGAYLAGSSEVEVRDTEVRRRRFLGEAEAAEESADSPLASGVRVGVSYVIGAVVPILPVLFGARTLLPSLVVAGAVIVLVSTILAFLSGMNVKRRILLNLAIMAGAVAISYLIGLVAQSVWGIRCEGVHAATARARPHMAARHRSAMSAVKTIPAAAITVMVSG